MTHGGVVVLSSRTKDGVLTLATDSRRLVASLFLWLGMFPLACGLVAALVWGPAPGLGVSAVVFLFGAAVTVASLLSSAREIEAVGRKSARLERALATASGALLKRGVTDPVGTALLALVDGVDAGSVFLDSIGDKEPDQAGTITTVRDVLRRTPEGDPAGWDLVPWRVSEATRKQLEAGAASVVRANEVDRRSAMLYLAAQVGSEIVFPISVEGNWVGNVGFGAPDQDRVWTDDEQQLLRIGAEMIGVYWERRDSIGRLEELIAAKDEFIASVSHEVRTPLTAVLGFAHELNEGPGKFTERERSDLIALITDQSQEVANIVDDLLVAARAEAGTIVVVPEVVSVRSAIGEVLASHSGRVDFSMGADADVGVWADPVRMRQVLRNLLTNADRYGGSLVKVHVVASSTAVRIEVRDNGEGIPESMRDHVFEPYGRGRSSTTQPASVGLGLAVARKLAQLMDGSLELSRESGWTVFSLALPLAGAVACEPSAPSVVRQPVGTPLQQAG